MTTSKKHFIRVGSINEFALNPDSTSNEEDDIKKDAADTGAEMDVVADEEPAATEPSPTDIKAPFVRSTPVIGMSVKGSATGGLPSGKTPDAKAPDKSALSGYEPVKTEKNNSELIDKTPTNSDLDNPSKLKNDAPKTDSEDHPHQIQTTQKAASDKIEGGGKVSNETPEYSGADSADDSVAIEVNESKQKLSKNDPRIKKLQSLRENYTRKPFLTMKEVLLLNEVNKVLNNVK